MDDYMMDDFELDLSPVYTLDILDKENIITIKDDNGPYEHTIETALFYEGQLCLEWYESSKGPDYHIYQRFTLYSKEDTEALVDVFGGEDGAKSKLKSLGINGFKEACLNIEISGEESIINPFEDKIKEILGED